MLVKQGYEPSKIEKKRLVKAIPVKEEKSFINKSVNASVIDLPYKGPENAKEIIKLDPYVVELKTKDDVVEDKKTKKKVLRVQRRRRELLNILRKLMI